MTSGGFSPRPRPSGRPAEQRSTRPVGAGIGIADTVSNGRIDLNRGLVSSLYNPYAAVPSMHIGYALVVGVSLLRYARSSVVRLGGLLYPPFVLLVVVASGNHFFFDAATGALTVAVAAGAALAIARPSAPAPERPARLPQRPLAHGPCEELAA